MELSNKYIVLTGGTSGVGRQLVAQLARDNQLIVLGRDQKKLHALKDQYPTIMTYQVDLESVRHVHQLGQELAQDLPKVDVLINNAAVQFMPQIHEDTFVFATVEREINTNFTSVCALIHGLLPALSKSKPARIVNVNSALGLVPKTSSAVYCASKGALNIFSQSLRYQFENSAIRVQQAFLPLVDTDMTKGRGKNKMSPESAASAIINGIEKSEKDFDIGAIRFLRVLLAFAPNVARRILKRT
ncbi:SDR family oxidoreductase [Vibrio fluminensis]|uniref:SDR family oxidoreductase n=1 Tax=Vibrio fluminensis TaxID=2783614 RepID=UPI0018883D89|nr:SDR family NAD(P)-dependent oxidoreductase [Vibrio fluminensis]